MILEEGKQKMIGSYEDLLKNGFDADEASSAILQKNPTNDELCDTATSRAKYMRLASHEHRILALFVSGRRLLNRVC